MPNEKPKDQPESKFAEATRKAKEKRRGMNQESQRRAHLEQESRDREETNEANQAFINLKDSET